MMNVDEFKLHIICDALSEATDSNGNYICSSSELCKRLGFEREYVDRRGDCEGCPMFEKGKLIEWMRES